MASEPIQPAELHQRDDQTVHVHLFYNEDRLDMRRLKWRMFFGAWVVVAVLGVGMYLLFQMRGSADSQASAAPPVPAAASAPAQPPQPVASAPARFKTLQEEYARAHALATHHAGVWTAQIMGKRAVLWIGTGSFLSQRPDTVTLPRLILYREALAGQPGVLVELVPESMQELEAFMACPVGSDDKPQKTLQEGSTCSAPATFSLAMQPGSGAALVFDDGSAANSPSIAWQRLADETAAAQGRAQHTDRDWFNLVVARGSHPVGEPVAKEGFFWQPMLHAPSGVQWDHLTQAPSPEALRAINQKMDDLLAVHVADALEAASRGKAVQASMRITFASPRWLNVQAALSQVDGERREASETNRVFDVASGKLVTFADGFFYATLKRLDGGIAIGPSGEVDQGILTAALGQMGARGRSRCMQRWLDAHQCSTLANCAYHWVIPKDMTLFPAQDGLAVQFNHWRVAQAAQEEGRELPEPLKGSAWDSCVQDTVVIPWEAAKRALRKNTRMDIS